MKRFSKLLFLLILVSVISFYNCDQISKQWKKLFRNEVEIFLHIKTKLNKNEPGQGNLLINEKKVGRLDSEGEGIFTYKAYEGENLKIKFEKEGYKSENDFIYQVQPENNVVRKEISFRKKTNEVTVNFTFKSLLNNNRSKPIQVYIGNRRAGKITSNSNNFQYTGNPGEKIYIKFKKDGYKSLNNFSYRISNKTNKIEKRIEFKKLELKLVATFKAKNKLPGVKISLKGKTLGKTNQNGIFVWSKKIKSNGSATYKFSVQHKYYDLKTQPENLVIKSNGKPQAKTFIITGYLNKAKSYNLQFVNYINDSPLQRVKVKFNDSEKEYVSNSNGKIHYNLKGKPYKQKIDFKVLEPGNLDLKNEIAPFYVNHQVSDSTNFKYKCELSYLLSMNFKNLNSRNLKKVEVKINDKKYYSDNNGNLNIPIKEAGKIYKLKISKDKYEPITKTVTLNQKKKDLGTIKLKELSGTLVFKNEVTNTAIPYVSIFENDKNIGQSSSRGKANIKINLGEALNFTFKPKNEKFYGKSSREIVFNNKNEIKTILLKPKPYVFNFRFVSTGGQPLSGVLVKYGLRQFLSDQTGNLHLETYQPFKSKDNKEIMFNYEYKSFQDSYPLNFAPEKRIYNIPEIRISLDVSFTVKSIPPDSKIKLLDGNKNVLLEGASPLSGKLGADIYHIHAIRGELEVNKNVEITKNQQVINIDLRDPIETIINHFRNKEYKKATGYYENQVSEENFNDSRKKYCKALDCLYQAYFKQKKYKKTYAITNDILDENCKGNDPYFFMNLGSLCRRINKWEASQEYFKDACQYRIGFQKDERARLAAECLYFRVSSRIERVREGGFSTKEAKCAYLNKTMDLLVEFVDLCMDKGLDTRNSQTLQYEINQLKNQAGCGS